MYTHIMYHIYCLAAWLPLWLGDLEVSRHLTFAALSSC